MSFEQLVAVIRSLNTDDAFRVRLDNSQWKAFGAYLGNQQVRPGDVIIRQGSTDRQAYFLGDLNLDLKNDYSDFQAFKLYYDAANGVGAFAAMVASVPEPSSLVIVASAGLLVRRRRPRSARR